MSDFIYKLEPGQSPTTLLLLHGTGGDENDLLELGRALAPGKTLLSPRGTSLDEGINRWFRRFGEGQFDEDDIRHKALELANWITDIKAEKALGDIYAFGFSNGANIAHSLLGLLPEAVSGVVVARGQYTIEPTANLTGKPVLILSGSQDQIVPRLEAEKLAASLRNHHADVDRHWFEAGHGLTREDFTVTKDWLAARP